MYYAAQVLAFRALMYPATRLAKATPNSSLRQWFGAALGELESFTSFVHGMTEEDLQGFWPRRKL